MQEIRVTDDYVLHLYEVTQTTCVAAVIHVRRAGGATIRESVGRLVAHVEPLGAEWRSYWDAELFLTSKRLVGGVSGGQPQLFLQEARSIPADLPDQIAATLLEQGILAEPLTLGMNEYVPGESICIGEIYFDD